MSERDRRNKAYDLSSEETMSEALADRGVDVKSFDLI